MSSPSVDPSGPVLVCYRQDDGAHHAGQVVSALRAVGVPAWFDGSDMGVGRFDHTFRRAAASGFAGTVFVATPGVSKSNFIRRDEAPVWDALARDPTFILAVVNAEEGPKADYRFPSSLVDLREQRLEAFKQYQVMDGGWLDELTSDIVQRRLEVLADQAPDGELRVEVSTRDEPSSRPTEWELRATIGPPPDGSTVLAGSEVGQVRRLTTQLPRLTARTGARTVRLRGGMHLPVAASIGLALPTTRPVRVVYEDNHGGVWDSAVAADPVELELREIAAADPAGGHAAMVDLVGSGDPGGEFVELVERLGAAASVVTATSRGQLAPAAGVATAAAAADMVRAFVGDGADRTVHLAFRTPAGLALHLGRHLNTHPVVLYDLDRMAGTYVRFATAMAGGPGGTTILEDPADDS